MKIPGKFFQTKLLSRLSHNVCRLLPSPVLLRTFTTLVGNACTKVSRNDILTSKFANLQYVFSSKTAKLWTATKNHYNQYFSLFGSINMAAHIQVTHTDV